MLTEVGRTGPERSRLVIEPAGGPMAGTQDRNPLSYDRGPSTPPLLETTIGANFAATAIKYADHDALVDVCAGRRWSYAELQAAVRRLATGLVRAGIGVGDRVGIWAPNRWEWVLVQYATAEVGAILVTINPAYRARELE